VIYARLSCERSLASRFYFRTEQSHNFFQVKYFSHVEYALKNCAKLENAKNLFGWQSLAV
jgi:hypothetical protein